MKQSVFILFLLSLGANLVFCLTLLSPSVQKPPAYAAGKMNGSGQPGFGAIHTNIIVSDDSQLAMTWAQLESPDYVRLVGNLREFQCPEQTTRDLVIARIDRVYNPKIRQLRDNPRVLMRNPSREDIAQNQASQAEADRLERERSTIISGLFGDSALADYGSEKMDHWGRALAIFPQEKQLPLKTLLEHYHQLRSDVMALTGGAVGDEDLDQLKQLDSKQREDLAKILTADELEKYDLQFSQTSQELRSQTRLLDIPEDEFIALFRLRNWYEQGVKEAMENGGGGNTAVLGLKEHYDTEQIKILGEKRYQDLAELEDNAFRGLMEVGKKYDLPRSLVDQAYTARNDAAAAARQVLRDSSLDVSQKAVTLENVRNEAQKQFVAILGEKAAATFLRSSRDWFEIPH